jgi:hypothetical protein
MEDFEGVFQVNYRLSTMASFQEGKSARTYYYRYYGQGFRYFYTHVINFEMPACQNYTCTVSVERVVPIKREQQLALLHRGKKQSGNWSLNEYGTSIESFPTEVEVLQN